MLYVIIMEPSAWVQFLLRATKEPTTLVSPKTQVFGAAVRVRILTCCQTLVLEAESVASKQDQCFRPIMQVLSLLFCRDPSLSRDMKVGDHEVEDKS